MQVTPVQRAVVALGWDECQGQEIQRSWEVSR